MSSARAMRLLHLAVYPRLCVWLLSLGAALLLGLTGCTATTSSNSAPQNVTVSVSGSTVTVSWSAVDGADSYTVYYGTTSPVTTSNATAVTGLTGTSTTISGLADGTYHLAMTATSSSGEGGLSTEVSFTIGSGGSTLPAPQNLAASVSGTSATVSWSAVTGATSYTVYYGTTSPVTTSNATATTGITGTSTTLSSLADGVYYVAVVAVTTSGHSSLSAQATFTIGSGGSTLAAPQSVTVTPGDDALTISWQPVTGATSYNVYYSQTSGAGTGGTKVVVPAPTPTLATAAATTTGVPVSTNIPNLTNGTLYYIAVTAVVSGNESAASSEVSLRPGVPANVTATGQDQRVLVTWVRVTGATGYTIYYATTSGQEHPSSGSVTKVTASASATSAFVTGLNNGIVYYITVMATLPSTSAEGPDSAEVSVVAGVPTNVAVVPGETTFTLSWTGVSGATSYNIYRSSSPGVSATPGNLIGSAGSTISTYTVTGVSRGTSAYFVITAIYNGGSESSASAEVSATAGVPPGVVAAAGDSSAMVSWSPVTGAQSYTIYYGTAAGVTPATGTAVAVSSGTAKTVSGLTNGTTYYFVVTATFSDGEGPVSAEVHAMPVALVDPASPDALSGAIQMSANGTAMTASSAAYPSAGNSSASWYFDSYDSSATAGDTDTYVLYTSAAITSVTCKVDGATSTVFTAAAVPDANGYIYVTITYPTNLGSGSFQLDCLGFDGTSYTYSTSLSITTTATGALTFTLTWDTFHYADMDLHVVEPDGNEIYYGNQGPSSSGGKQDVDNTYGFGPETSIGPPARPTARTTSAWSPIPSPPL